MRFRCMSRQGGSSAILQKAFFKHALVNSNNNRLLFTPFTVTRFAMHRNHALHDFAPQLSGFL